MQVQVDRLSGRTTEQLWRVLGSRDGDIYYVTHTNQFAYTVVGMFLNLCQEVGIAPLRSQARLVEVEGIRVHFIPAARTEQLRGLSPDTIIEWDHNALNFEPIPGV